MKKLLSVFITLAMLLPFCACHREDAQKQDTSQFHYLRKDIIYGADDGVIACEERDLSESDLTILLDLYLSGPKSEELISPFPAKTKLLSLNSSGNTLTLLFSNELDKLDGMDFILACACLSRTCFELCDAAEVTIRILGTDRSITMTPESLTLSDDSDTIDATIGTEPLGD